MFVFISFFLLLFHNVRSQLKQWLTVEVHLQRNEDQVVIDAQGISQTGTLIL